MEIFSDYAYYYNLFYGNKDYENEAMVLDRLIRKYSVRNVIDILDMGCGTGRHDFELCELGYKVSGIDLSQNMIEVANKAKGNRDVTFEVADVRNYKSERKYDAVVSMFHVMSYQCTNGDIINAFRTASKACDTGGIFIFDVWYGPGVLSDKPSVRVKQVEDDNNILIRYANPIMYAERNVVDVCYDVLVIDKKTAVSKELKETHSMRYFFAPEIEFFLSQAGFRMEACVDCNTLDETDYNSWTAYFVAVKR